MLGKFDSFPVLLTEERRLEHISFGKPYPSQGVGPLGASPTGLVGNGPTKVRHCVPFIARPTTHRPGWVLCARQLVHAVFRVHLTKVDGLNSIHGMT